MLQTPTGSAYLLLYVDDIIHTASSTTMLQHIISHLDREFAMTYLGALNYFLGISAVRSLNDMFLSHKKYVTDILQRAHMMDYNPCCT